MGKAELIAKVDAATTMKALKDLVKEVNAFVSQDKRITGYSKLLASEKEKLRSDMRKLLKSDKVPAMKKIEEEPEDSDSEEENGRRGDTPLKRKDGKCLETSPGKIYSTTLERYINLKFTDTIVKHINELQCMSKFGVTDANQIAEGSYGSVFMARYNGKSVIYKHVDFETLKLESFRWEYAISQHAANIGVGPKVISGMLCRWENEIAAGGIVLGECTKMKSLENDMKDLANFKKLMKVIDRMHKGGIAHRDLAERNIMKSGDNYVIIDYGLSLMYNGPVPHEMRVWDLAYLAREMDISKFLNQILPAKDIKLIGRLNGGNKNGLQYNLPLESLTIKHFPKEMIATLGYDQANYRINNANYIEQEIDKLLQERFIYEGFPAVWSS